MTAAEAAKKLEVKTTVIYDLCSKKLLGHSRVGLGRGVIRISEDDLEAYRVSCRVEAQPPSPRGRPSGTGLAVRSIIAEMHAEEDRKKAERASRPRANGRCGS